MTVYVIPVSLNSFAVMKNIAFEQLELGINGEAIPQVQNCKRQRVPVANWWFTKMRQVVDLALPARERLHGRPEQTYLKLRQKMLA
jgi:hypothetical protein